MALAIWALFALGFLALFLIDLRLDYNQVLVPCQGAECNWMALSPAEAAALEFWGLSMQIYALFMTGLAVITVVVYWILAGLILVRQGATRIGLAVSLALLAIPIALISDTANVYVSYPGLIYPSVFLQSLGMIALALFLYLFPNGRFYPRYATIPFAGVIVIILIRGILEFRGHTALSPAQMPLFMALIVLVTLGPVFQFLRYRRDATPLERQQTKWALYGFFVLILGIPLWMIIFSGLVEMPTGAPGLMLILIGWAGSMVTLIALPVTIAIAILRYRLWDIDLIIRKTIIYAVLTGLLGLIYFGVVLGLQFLSSSVLNLDSGNVTIVLSTLAIAALFNPLRRRIQNDIDRRFYRRRYDAEKVMASFSERLREEMDLDEMTKSILLVVEETMQPEEVTLWLRSR
jgi:hypothetical protein